MIHNSLFIQNTKRGRKQSRCLLVRLFKREYKVQFQTYDLRNHMWEQESWIESRRECRFTRSRRFIWTWHSLLRRFLRMSLFHKRYAHIDSWWQQQWKELWQRHGKACYLPSNIQGWVQQIEGCKKWMQQQWRAVR